MPASFKHWEPLDFRPAAKEDPVALWGDIRRNAKNIFLNGQSLSALMKEKPGYETLPDGSTGNDAAHIQVVADIIGETVLKDFPPEKRDIMAKGLVGHLWQAGIGMIAANSLKNQIGKPTPSKSNDLFPDQRGSMHISATGGVVSVLSTSDMVRVSDVYMGPDNPEMGLVRGNLALIYGSKDSEEPLVTGYAETRVTLKGGQLVCSDPVCVIKIYEPALESMINEGPNHTTERPRAADRKKSLAPLQAKDRELIRGWGFINKVQSIVSECDDRLRAMTPPARTEDEWHQHFLREMDKPSQRGPGGKDVISPAGWGAITANYARISLDVENSKTLIASNSNYKYYFEKHKQETLQRHALLADQPAAKAATKTAIEEIKQLIEDTPWETGMFSRKKINGKPVPNHVWEIHQLCQKAEKAGSNPAQLLKEIHALSVKAEEPKQQIFAAFRQRHRTTSAAYRVISEETGKLLEPVSPKPK